VASGFGFGRHRNSSEEGVGWIYADLFLALTIVGIGSASITAISSAATPDPAVVAVETTTTIATGDGDDPAESTTSTSPTTTTIAEAFQLSCVEFAIPLDGSLANGTADDVVSAAIAQEVERRGWDADDARPGMVLVMGGYNNNESASAGDVRARNLVPALRNAVPQLADVEIRTLGAQVVRVQGESVTVGGAGSAVLVVYLVHRGDPLDEDCTL
jgi:hypothetical protein